MEHLRHFSLTEDPFRNEPRQRDFAETAPARQALARLERGLRQSRGLLVLTGAVGAGKTMVVRRLLEALEEEVFEAAMLVVVSGSADAGWLLGRLAALLGVEEPAREPEALLGQLHERLAIVREDGRHAVLIVDDAEILAAQGALPEVCGLLKLEYEETRLLSLVLAGGPGLEAAIRADPSLLHRVEVNVRLAPLAADAAAAYLGHRIRRAGGTPAIFTPEAVAALCQRGAGLPGRMNVLADNALFEAFLCGRRSVGPAEVEGACRDLGWDDGGGASADPVGEPLGAELEAELDAVFEEAAASGPLPAAGPPKDDDGEDLVVELLEG